MIAESHHINAVFVVDLDPCRSKPCKNLATCINVGASFKCACRNYYYGLRCDSKLLLMIIINVLYVMPIIGIATLRFSVLITVTQILSLLCTVCT